MKASQRLSLEARGFTVADSGVTYCDSCEAMSINGHATHERGCPNRRHECNGCNALIPVNVRYCEDCA